MLREAQQSARRIAEMIEADLRTQIHNSLQEAQVLKDTLQRMYEGANNPDAPLALQRSAGIASFFRAKEMAQQKKHAEEDVKKRPTTDAEWSSNLQRRHSTRPQSPKKGDVPQKKGKKSTSTTSVVDDGEVPSTSTASSTSLKSAKNQGTKRKGSPATTTSTSTSSSSCASDKSKDKSKNKTETKTKKQKKETKGKGKESEELTAEERAILKLLKKTLKKM